MSCLKGILQLFVCMYVTDESDDWMQNIAAEMNLSETAFLKKNLAKADIRGTIVTCHSNDSKYDFVSRFFAPAFGVDEDPVTGSAHCALGP